MSENRKRVLLNLSQMLKIVKGEFAVITAIYGEGRISGNDINRDTDIIDF